MSAQVPLLVQRLLSLRYVKGVNTAVLQTDPDEPSQGEENQEERPEQDETAVLNLHDDTLLRDLEERDGEETEAMAPRETVG